MKESKPEFLIIGAPKSGSSWLLQMLRKHPQVFMPDGEVHYFNSVQNYRKGWDWYLSKFEGADPSLLWGEKTPDYLLPKKIANDQGIHSIPELISRNLPKVKLIASLREPSSRSESQMNHLVRTRRIPPWFDWQKEISREKSLYNWIEGSIYANNLEPYFEIFPREQIKVVFFEEMMANPKEHLEDICSFLGIDPSFDFPAKQSKINAFYETKPQVWMKYRYPLLAKLSGPLFKPFFPTYKVKAPDAVKKQLVDFFQPHNQNLEDLLGRKTPWNH